MSLLQDYIWVAGADLKSAFYLVPDLKSGTAPILFKAYMP